MANGSDDNGLTRRSFVKGCAIAGTAGVAAAAGFSMGKPISLVQGGTIKNVEYIAAKKVGGPAPRGIPLLPLEVGDDGVIRGSPTLDGESVLDWYKYCGHEGAPGLQEAYEGDEVLRYFVVPSKLAQGFDPWYGDRIGEPVKAEHFEEMDRGAAVQWRSQGEEGANIISATIIKTSPERHAFEGVPQDLVMEAGLEDGFVAFVSFCTHFCCVPGWKEAEDQARARGAWDDLYCTCHHSIYDPFTLSSDSFQLKLVDEEESPLKPGARPEEDH